MSISLPKPVEAYFSADLSNGETVAQCFTEDAVVKDEGHTYIGAAAINEWKTSSSKKYTYTVAPYASENRDGKTIVTGTVSGNFPGSPIDLKYTFVLKADKIAALEITV